mmetsp:Transcript_66447/g.138498  ORF Transcript_66447/g.138498 Transcript_66447/m.138498 type:complete len:81 (-) Transcript_66447:666-908(-)
MMPGSHNMLRTDCQCSRCEALMRWPRCQLQLDNEYIPEIVVCPVTSSVAGRTVHFGAFQTDIPLPPNRGDNCGGCTEATF